MYRKISLIAIEQALEQDVICGNANACVVNFSQTVPTNHVYELVRSYCRLMWSHTCAVKPSVTIIIS